MKKLLLSLITLFLVLPVYSEELKKVSRVEYIMGTLFKIEIYYEDEKKAEEIIDQAFKTLRKADKVMSNYDENSEISLVQKQAYLKPIKLSDDLYVVLKKSLYFADLTKGEFDITIEPLVKLWGFKSKYFKKPSLEKINQVKKQVGYKNIIIDDKNKTIFIKNKKIKIDFGGIGKGYGIEKAVNTLKKYGVKSGFIDSTSNQYYIGSPPDKEFWTVGIKDPRNENTILKILKVKDASVSTSGDYEQFFMENNIRYSHIISPKTGFPIKEKIASTIVCENATDADALSTSVLLIDEKYTQNLLNKFKVLYSLVVSEKKGKFELKEYEHK